jgi:hypothetical protein
MKNKNEREKFQRTETTEYTVYIIVFFLNYQKSSKIVSTKNRIVPTKNATDHVLFTCASSL